MLRESELNSRIMGSLINYCYELHKFYSKLLVVRVDLGYGKEYAKACSLVEIKRDIKHMLDNRRGNRSLFEHLVGYFMKYEFTEEKGPHAHALFFYDGQRVRKDEHYGDQIGHYWNEKITGGNGVFHNCNYDKDRYKQCGIGMIDHSDIAKRKILIDRVISYMLKEEQSIDSIKQSSRDRAITKAVLPRHKSSAGRPRN